MEKGIRFIIGFIAIFAGLFVLIIGKESSGDNSVVYIISGSLVAAGFYMMRQKKTQPMKASANQRITTSKNSTEAFNNIETKEKVFKNVVYKGGLPGIEPGTAFNNIKMDICALSEGITLYNSKTGAIQAVLPWNRLVKIETFSKLSDTNQAFVTGAAVKSKGFGQGLATGVAAGMLTDKALIFHMGQNENDNFVQEVKFDDARNEEIKAHIMSKRASIFPDGIKPSSKVQDTQGDDILSQISKLAALKEQGILTEAEFSEKKIVLLNKIK